MKVEIKNLKKLYSDKTIFDNLNLTLYDDKVNCIIGESGCGKSTLLNIMAGLTDKNSGIIEGIEKKEISYIFQEDRLVEYLTIKENLNIALKKYFKRDTLMKRIKYVLEITGLSGIENKYPNELSGGMRQRVNIARAIGKPSKVILMDEPFKSLDYKIKYSIIDEFKSIIEKEKRIVVMVTHDVDEAIYFDGRIIVFSGSPVKIQGTFSENLLSQKGDILNLI